MKKPISIRLKVSSLDRVDEFAREKGWTRTEALERLIDEALARRHLLIGEKVPDTWKAGDEHFRHVRPSLGDYPNDK